MHAVVPTKGVDASDPSSGHVIKPASSSSPKSHPFLWLLVVLTHALCVFFAGYVGILYLRLPIDASTLMTSVELYAIAVPTKFFKLIAAAYLALAITHALILLRLLFVTLSFRRLLLAAPKSSGIPSSLPESLYTKLRRATQRVLQSQRVASMSKAAAGSKDSKLRTISSGAMSTARALASSSKITDPNYGKHHAVRELVETAFLTAQAYKSSYRVASPWINTAQVALLVLNCWSFPLAHRVLHASVGHARMVGLAINLCIDLTMYIFIPTFLYLPYWRDYNPVIGEFGIVFWYTDRWLVRMLNEFPMLFVTSFWDGVSKLFIGASITRTLLDIPVLVHFVDAGHDKKDQQPQKPTRIERGCRIILLSWGAVVLALHIHAATLGENPRCLEQVRPWMARRPACSLAEINCKHNEALTGGASDFDAALSDIDHRFLTYLIVRHCPAVEITPALQELRNMVGFKVYNSSLRRWGDNAALTAQHHPRIMFVFLAATNMTEFPPALYSPEFPPQLADIEVCRSNLTALPDALADVWPRGIFLLLEEVAFPVVPPVLRRLRPYFLSLSANTFTSVPAFVLQNPILLFLKVNGNPLTALPELPTNGSSVVSPIKWFHIARTQLADVPAWLNVDDIVAFVATDSPLCKRLLALNESSPMDARTAALKRHVLCHTRPGVDPLYHFPINIEPVINP
ncbi:hypothetical protein PINS_up009333 [Pythium insidiosum]|nr:hypothetical protein PINS_up009333 [Pythium insidiosum]